MDLTALPGHELVITGLNDLKGGRKSIEAMLVAVGSPRLRRAGLEVPEVGIENPEHELFAMLASSDADSAHARYNALIRQLVSFERALECVA